jgi:hypothetical protein
MINLRSPTVLTRCVILIIAAALASGCCDLDNNRRSREGLERLAGVLRAQGEYVKKSQPIDPRGLATRADGSIDVKKCLMHAKWLESFEVGNAVMAKALEEWSRGEDVTPAAASDRDYKELCKP